MPDTTARIKNLSFALEALSRVCDLSTERYQIEKLLRAEIKKAEEENEEPPVKTSTTEDDDIPF